MIKDTNNIYSPKLGLVRSLLAFGNLLTLLFNKPTELIPENIFIKNKMVSDSMIQDYNIFFLFNYEDIVIPYIICIIILLVVIIGYFPQITCVPQAYVAYSVFYGVTIVEGGDQITAIICLLIIPICLFDKRINHWYIKEFFKYDHNDYIRYLCYTTLCFIQIQISVIYLDSVIEKFGVPQWVDGTVVYYWATHNVFGATGLFEKILYILFRYNLTTTSITWAVLIIELLMFAAFFMNTNNKRKMFYIGIVFHFLIFIIHGLASFGIAMSAALILYLTFKNEYNDTLYGKTKNKANLG